MATCGLEKSNNVDWSGVMPSTRALHYVFKIGNRQKSIDFYKNVLKMKVLRHEEFEEGCKATCNGPYNGKWSKTMIGYGSEDDNFVLELTYNYEIGSYKLGNDFFGLFIDSDAVFDSVKEHGGHGTRPCGRLDVTDPDGHHFMIAGGAGFRVTKVATQVKNLNKSIEYWHKVLGMALVDKNEEKKTARLSYGEKQCMLELREHSAGIERGCAFGRIAFSCPGNKLADLEKKMKDGSHKIVKELVTLETPGKADVQVVILADPDDHEICFVGDEGFRELSKIDPKADNLLDEAMKKDDSESWFKDGKKQG